MFARTWALGFVCSLIGISVATTTACSSKANHAATGTLDGNSDDPESDAGKKASQDNPDEGDDSASGDAGAKNPASGPSCVSTGSDDPDDNFADSNCDGIDGDKNKAIFVATSGSDAADGSMSEPVATLAHGIELAVAASKDVYVCKGEYSEGTIQLTTKGVRVYGGYDCTAKWVRNSQSQAHLASTSSTAISIKDVSDAVVFDRVDVTAANGKAGSESSIAVFISNSKNVTLRRGTWEAGSGANGAQPAAAPAAQNSIPACAGYVYSTGQCFGEPGTDAYQYKNCFYTGATLPSAPYTDPSYFSLAPASKLTDANICKGGILSSYGGQGGGTAVADRRNGSDGGLGSPASTTGDLHGADGTDGSLGSAAAQGIGTLTAGGYASSNQGAPGTSGSMGQAGTGGNGGGFTIVYQGGASEFQTYYYAPRAGGGKGGWAGCPGDGGAGGNAGGASIAVAIFQSQITLERITVTTSNGGNGSAGGLGAQGAAGQPGGAPGTAYYQCAQCVSGQATVCSLVNKTNTTSAQSGGHGGKGGNGAQGGPGGGGPSIPLVVSGNAPTLSAVTFLPGSGGIGGSNGGARAADGESTDQKVLP